MENNQEEKALAVITKKELSKVDNPILNAQQLDYLLKKTPKSHIYQRKGKGGSDWNYVTGVYVKKVLNLMFGWDWSFEVKEYKFDMMIGQAFVLGKLTVTTQGRSIIKEQFGRVDIKFKREPDANGNRMPLDLGNDLKAATTDALKKCAAELGIASDVYAPNEFKEIRVVEEELDWDFLRYMLDNKNVPSQSYNDWKDIIDSKDETRYKKLKHELEKIKNEA